MKSSILFLMLLTAAACTQTPAEVVYKGDNFYGRTGNEIVFSPSTPALYSQDSPKYKADQYNEPAAVPSVGVQELAPIKVNSVEPPVMAQNKPVQTAAISSPAPVSVAPVATAPVAAPAPLPALAAAVPEKQAASAPAGAAFENKVSVNLFPARPVASAAPSSKNARFIWPVQGKLLSKFGTRVNGQLNDGINIAADEGEPIWAAADGTVVYAGDQIKGYGNMVIIRHPDGWVTTYAHASRLAVSKDDVVKQGQIIAYVGASGSVQSAQLHFGIREGVEPVNPERFLSRDVAALK